MHRLRAGAFRRTERFLVAGALALVPGLRAWSVTFSFMEVTPETGLLRPGRAALVTLDGRPHLAVIDLDQVKAVPLGDGPVQVLAAPAAAEGAAAGAAQVVEPAGLAVDAQGCLLISDVATHQVLRRSADGNLAVVPFLAPGRSVGAGAAPKGSGLDRPMALAVGPGGEIHVADNQNRRVLRRDPDGRVERVIGPGGVPPLAKGVRFGFPRDLLATADGGLVVIASTPAGVWRLDGKGVLAELPGLVEPDRPSLTPSQGSGREPGFLANPSHLAAGRDGSVLVADAGADRLWRHWPDRAREEVALPWAGTGEALRLSALSGLPHGGVVVTAGGRMWVAFPGPKGDPSARTLARWMDKAVAAELRGAPQEAAKYRRRIRAGRFAPGADGDGAAERQRTFLRSQAALRNVDNRVRRQGALRPAPMVVEGEEFKGAPVPVAVPPAAVAAPGAGGVTRASQEPDAAAPADAVRPRKRPREEASQVDAASQPPAAAGQGPAASLGRDGSGPGSAPPPDSMGLRYSPTPESQTKRARTARDLVEEFRRLDQLTADLVAAGHLTAPQAAPLAAWLKDHWEAVHPTLDDLQALAGAARLSQGTVGRYITTVRFRFDHIPAADSWDPTRDHGWFRGFGPEGTEGTPASPAGEPVEGQG